MRKPHKHWSSRLIGLGTFIFYFGGIFSGTFLISSMQSSGNLALGLGILFIIAFAPMIVGFGFYLEKHEISWKNAFWAFLFPIGFFIIAELVSRKVKQQALISQSQTVYPRFVGTDADRVARLPDDEMGTVNSERPTPSDPR